MQTPVAYSKAFAARPPREVVIGIAKDVQGKYNPIALGMFTHVAGKPPVLAVSIGKEQYSLQAFRLAKEFVIALPAETQAEETMVYGTKSGRDCDKLTLAGAKTLKATQIDCVLLEEAAANYECKLIAETAVGEGIRRDVDDTHHERARKIELEFAAVEHIKTGAKPPYLIKRLQPAYWLPSPLGPGPSAAQAPCCSGSVWADAAGCPP
jgi:flavin reductase (DIM6/NTAB) family NADH-FMN oxidoreductase RutF